MLNRLGGVLDGTKPPRAVTLPKLKLPDIDVEAEAREAAARIAERRLIRNGLTHGTLSVAPRVSTPGKSSAQRSR